MISIIILLKKGLEIIQWLSIYKEVFHSHIDPAKINQEDSTSRSHKETELDDEASGLGIQTSTRARKYCTRWQTKVFSIRCLRYMMSLVGKDKTHFDLKSARDARATSLELSNPDYDANNYLVFHLADLITIAFSSATNTVSGMQIAGQFLLDDILCNFGEWKDPDLEESALLEQYEVQITSSFKSAFGEDASPQLTSAASGVVASLLVREVTRDPIVVRRIIRMILTAIEKPTIYSPLYREVYGTQVHLAHLKSLARLYLACVSKTSTRGTLTIVEEEMLPHLDTLLSHWADLLRDFGILLVFHMVSPNTKSKLSQEAAQVQMRSKSREIALNEENHVRSRFFELPDAERSLLFFRESWLDVSKVIVCIAASDCKRQGVWERGSNLLQGQALLELIMGLLYNCLTDNHLLEEAFNADNSSLLFDCVTLMCDILSISPRQNIIFHGVVDEALETLCGIAGVHNAYSLSFHTKNSILRLIDNVTSLLRNSEGKIDYSPNFLRPSYYSDSGTNIFELLFDTVFSVLASQPESQESYTLGSDIVAQLPNYALGLLQMAEIIIYHYENGIIECLQAFFPSLVSYFVTCLKFVAAFAVTQENQDENSTSTFGIKQVLANSEVNTVLCHFSAFIQSGLQIKSKDESNSDSWKTLLCDCIESGLAFILEDLQNINQFQVKDTSQAVNVLIQAASIIVNHSDRINAENVVFSPLSLSEAAYRAYVESLLYSFELLNPGTISTIIGIVTPWINRNISELQMQSPKPVKQPDSFVSAILHALLPSCLECVEYCMENAILQDSIVNQYIVDTQSAFQFLFLGLQVAVTCHSSHIEASATPIFAFFSDIMQVVMKLLHTTNGNSNAAISQFRLSVEQTLVSIVQTHTTMFKSYVASIDSSAKLELQLAISEAMALAEQQKKQEDAVQKQKEMIAKRKTGGTIALKTDFGGFAGKQAKTKKKVKERK